MINNTPIPITGLFKTMSNTHLCLVINGEDHWFPFLCIQHDIVAISVSRNDEVQIQCPEWLLIRKGLEWMIEA